MSFTDHSSFSWITHLFFFTLFFSLNQQYKLAKYCEEVFGDYLLRTPIPDCEVSMSVSWWPPKMFTCNVPSSTSTLPPSGNQTFLSHLCFTLESFTCCFWDKSRFGKKAGKETQTFLWRLNKSFIWKDGWRTFCSWGCIYIVWMHQLCTAKISTHKTQDVEQCKFRWNVHAGHKKNLSNFLHQLAHPSSVFFFVMKQMFDKIFPWLLFCARPIRQSTLGTITLSLCEQFQGVGNTEYEGSEFSAFIIGILSPHVPKFVFWGTWGIVGPWPPPPEFFPVNIRGQSWSFFLRKIRSFYFCLQRENVTLKVVTRKVVKIACHFRSCSGCGGGEEDSRGPNEIFLRNNNFFVVFARDCPFVVRSLFFDLFLKTSECAISHLFFGRHRVFSFPFWLRCPSHVWLQEIQFQSLNIPFVWSVILSTNASSLCIKWPTVHCRMRTNCRLTTFSWSQGCRCRLQTSSRGRSSSRTNGWNRKWRKVRSSICRVLSPTSALLQPIWFSRDSFAHSHSTNPRSNSRARCFCRATGDVHEGSGRVDHRRRRQRGGSGPRRRQPRWVARMRRKIHCLD